ncbi:MAG TPA: type II/IV secretion system protein, partial [Candidatus Saccharimonadales bacterium]
MRITDSLVEKLLQNGKRVTKEQLAALHEQKKTDKLPLQDLAVKNNLVTEQELTKLYADEIDVPYIELNAKEIKPAVLKLLSERIARQYNAVVFDVDKHGTNLLAVEDPDDIQALNFLQKQLGNDVKVHITTTSLLQAAL